VTISGTSTYFGATTASNATVTFTCVARVGDGSFFIPPVVLLALPPSTARAPSNIVEPGSIAITSFSPAVTSLNASGIEFGGISAVSVYGGSMIYQQ